MVALILDNPSVLLAGDTKKLCITLCTVNPFERAIQELGDLIGFISFGLVNCVFNFLILMQYKEFCNCFCTRYYDVQTERFKVPYSGGDNINQLQLTNFAYTLIGEVVEYDMPLEYLLYLITQC